MGHSLRGISQEYVTRAVVSSGPSLRSAQRAISREGRDVGIVGLIIVAILYWYGWFGLAFWMVVAVIINGVLGAIRAIKNPDWFWAKRRRDAPGLDPIIVTPDDTRRLLIEMCIVKGLTIPIYIVLAWYLGSRAGYFVFRY